MTSASPQSDQASVIKRLIMQHVREERPDFAALVDRINSYKYVIMFDLPGLEDNANEEGNHMCEIVHAHGNYVVIRPCKGDSEPFTPPREQFVINLSRWHHYFVEFHTDFYGMADIDYLGEGGRGEFRTIID